MKLYHGSPKSLNVIKPQIASGDDEFENQKAIFLSDNFDQAALYSLGKTLKGKTVFALPPGKLIIVGNYHPSATGYVYEVEVNGKKGIWDQYSYDKPIKVFKKVKIRLEEYQDKIYHVPSKENLLEICSNEKKKWLKA